MAKTVSRTGWGKSIVAARYELELYSPAGTRLASIEAFSSLSLARRVNQPGALTASFPASVITPSGPLALVGNTTWLVRRMTRRYSASGQEIIGVEAVDGLERLARRVVAYAGDSAYTNKTAAADDLLKAIMRENFGSLATDTSRNLSSYLSIEANTSAAPSVSSQLEWGNVLQIAQDIARAAWEAGTYLAFDVESAAIPAFQFVTRTGQRGTDHRYPSGAAPVLIGPDYGNLVDVEITSDYLTDVNHVYAIGQGEGQLTTTAIATDAARIAASFFNRRELAANSTGTDGTPGALADAANAALRAGLPGWNVRGRLIDTPGSLFGLDYDYGGYLTVQVRSARFDCRLMAFGIRLGETGEERIDAVLESEEGPP